MKNYKQLLKKISKWMNQDSLLFIHYFCHKAFAYHFEVCVSLSLKQQNSVIFGLEFDLEVVLLVLVNLQSNYYLVTKILFKFSFFYQDRIKSQSYI